MTPIRIMSSRVIGMVEFGFSDTFQDGAGRIGKSIYTNLRAPRFAGKPCRGIAPTYQDSCRYSPAGTSDAGARRGRSSAAV